MPSSVKYCTICSWFYSYYHWNGEVAVLNSVVKCCAAYISTYTKDFLIEFSFLSSKRLVSGLWQLINVAHISEGNCDIVWVLTNICCTRNFNSLKLLKNAEEWHDIPVKIFSNPCFWVMLHGKNVFHMVLHCCLSDQMCNLVMAVCLSCHVHDYWNARTKGIACLLASICYIRFFCCLNVTDVIAAVLFLM